MKLQYRTLKYYHKTAPKITQYCTAIPQTLTPPSITEVLMILIDVLVYLLANNSAGSRPLDKGTAVCKNFLGPFGPHFGLKIRGGGGGDTRIGREVHCASGSLIPALSMACLESCRPSRPSRPSAKHLIKTHCTFVAQKIRQKRKFPPG